MYSIPRNKTVLLALILCSFSSSSALHLKGRVVNETTQPLAGVTVLLAGLELSALTGSDGTFTIGQLSPIINTSQHLRSVSPSISASQLRFSPRDMATPIVIDLFNLKGGLMAPRFHQILSPGTSSFNLTSVTSQLPPGMAMMQVMIGSETYLFRGVTLSCGTVISHTVSHIVSSPTSRMGTTSNFSDSLVFTLAGYENAVRSITDENTTLSDVVLNKGIAFEPYFTGSGKITDLRTGSIIQIPMEKRIHVMVFPEGYTQANINAGLYERDIGTWFNEIFALKIHAYMKEAFIIWKYSAPSNQQLTGDGSVDSYFKLPLNNGQMASSGYGPAEAVTWEALNKFPFKPKDFHISLNARNLVCSYILFDPSRGRAGYSGQARTFTNPSATSQRVWVAMAMGHAHEFIHALVRVADEYHNASHTPVSANTLTQSSRYITNVISSPNCETLPWKHLLVGGTINPNVDSLIGAFGTNGRYHAEFKCQMNGSHQNGDLYGGSSNLQVNRLCNWCDELSTFRIYERAGVLSDPNTSWNIWVTSFRTPHYTNFGFSVPSPVPQRNSLGTEVFYPCQPLVVASGQE